MSRWLGALALMMLGCGGASPRASGCTTSHPTQLTLADGNVAGTDIDPPIGCNGGWYVRLWREGGERTIATEDTSSVCRERPGEDDACTAVDADALLRETVATLEQQGVAVSEIGPGPCGGGAQSIAINDWSNADAAVRALAETMERWDVQGQAGVAVRVPSCSSRLGSQGRRGG